jgi:hypothetical protein
VASVYYIKAASCYIIMLSYYLPFFRLFIWGYEPHEISRASQTSLILRGSPDHQDAIHSDSGMNALSPPLNTRFEPQNEYGCHFFLFLVGW